MLQGATRPMSSGGSIRGSIRGKWLRLLLALGLGVVAFALVVAALRSQEGSGGVVTAPAVTSISIVTAARDVPAGQRITAEMLELTAMPPDLALADAFNRSELVTGRFARIPIYRGEQLVEAKLASVGDGASGLSYTVPDGYRAMAVEVDKVVGAGGLLRPGDRVDVVAVLIVGDDGNRALTIAQNVEVLAVEQKLINVVPAAEGATAGSDGTLVDQPDAQPKGSVATLALTPEQAQQVLLAEVEGSIRLSVRAPGDSAEVALPNASFVESANAGAGPNGSETAVPLSQVVPEGMRTMAVGVDRVIAAGGLLRPGDRVDVLALLELQQTDASGTQIVDEARVVTIAQYVQVLAVEQRLLEDPTVSASDAIVDQSATLPSATAVTLAVTPLQAQQILLAEARGVIRLSLRPTDETEILDLNYRALLAVTDPRFQGLVEEAFRELG